MKREDLQLWEHNIQLFEEGTDKKDTLNALNQENIPNISAF